MAPNRRKHSISEAKTYFKVTHKKLL